MTAFPSTIDLLCGTTIDDGIYDSSQIFSIALWTTYMYSDIWTSDLLV